MVFAGRSGSSRSRLKEIPGKYLGIVRTIRVRKLMDYEAIKVG